MITLFSRYLFGEGRFLLGRNSQIFAGFHTLEKCLKWHYSESKDYEQVLPPEAAVRKCSSKKLLWKIPLKFTWKHLQAYTWKLQACNITKKGYRTKCFLWVLRKFPEEQFCISVSSYSSRFFLKSNAWFDIVILAIWLRCLRRVYDVFGLALLVFCLLFVLVYSVLSNCRGLQIANFGEKTLKFI